MKAFTLLEVIVSLLLSSIIIGMAISSYSMVGQQFRLFDEMTSTNLELLRLHNYIKYDTDKADILYYENNQLICKMMEGEQNNNIIYTLNKNSIVRITQMPFQKRDSIPIIIQNIYPSFKNKSVDYGAIDKILIQIKPYHKTESIIYSKRYSAVQLMKVNSTIVK